MLRSAGSKTPGAYILPPTTRHHRIHAKTLCCTHGTKTCPLPPHYQPFLTLHERSQHPTHPPPRLFCQRRALLSTPFYRRLSKRPSRTMPLPLQPTRLIPSPLRLLISPQEETSYFRRTNSYSRPGTKTSTTSPYPKHAYTPGSRAHLLRGLRISQRHSLAPRTRSLSSASD